MTSARSVESIEAFTAGELSPRVVNQRRLSYRGIACKRVFNFGIRPEGSAYYRAATTYIGPAVSHGVSSRLLPFIFNRIQTYVIEACLGIFRFYRDDAVIEDPGSPGNPLEVASPYDANDLKALQHAQDKDVLFLAAGGDPGKNIQRLQRLADDNWELKAFEFIDGPYLTQNTDESFTINPSAATGTITLTASQALWAATDVGRLVSLKHSSNRGYAVITGFTSDTVVDAEVKKDFGAATATFEWRLGVFSDTTGWPAALTFFEKRFFIGGARDNPARYDGSLAQILDEFDPDDTAKGGPISDFAGGQQLNPIYWLISLQDLLVGTLGGVFRTRGETDSAPLAPDAASTPKQARRSAEQVSPIETDDGALFVGINGKTLYELIFDLAVNKYRPLDRSVRARHVIQSGIVRLLYQESPFTRVWGIRRDGRIGLMTYLPEENIYAWHVYEIGGPNGTRGHVEDGAIIPGGEDDEIWLLVRRTNAAGLTRRFIERLEPPFDEDDDVFNGKFLDAGVQYDGTVTTTDLLYAANEGEIIMTTEADVFQAGDVGRQIRYRELLTPSEYERAAVFADAWGEIITFTSAREVRVRTIVPFPAGQNRVPAGSWGLTATEISGPGLDALAELSVELGVTADGLNVGPLKYQNAKITLPGPALKARVGFQYDGELSPIDLDTALRMDMARVDRTGIGEVAVRFLRTLHAEVGPERGRTAKVEFRSTQSQTDLPPPLFSGDKEVNIPGTSRDNGSIVIVQTEPLPCEVIGIYAKPRSSTA